MHSRMMRWLQSITIAIAIAVFACLALTGSAQTFRGGISGIVTDPSGAAVASANVQAVNDGTGQLRQTVSSSAGEFTFQDIPLGTYTITVSAPGFETVKTNKVPVSAGSVYNLPVKLSPAAQSTTIEVAASALALDTTSPTQTSTIAERSVQDIPLNGRDFTQLIALTPGFAGYSANGTDGSLNGARTNQINWQIDGVDNNDAWHNIPAVNQSGVSGIAGVILPVDAIESFSVQTQSAPEAGRNPGGTVNLGLKSGTNRFHGTAYYFNRNEFFGAGSPFQDTKQKVRNYNAGGSVGGPILRDKLFFFGAFEKQRFVIGLSGRATQPSLAYQTQAKALLTEHNVPINSATEALLNTLWPASALNGPAAPNNYASSDPEDGYSYNGIIKADYNINDHNSISFHWFSGEGNSAAPVGSDLKWYYQTAPTHVQNYAIVVNSQLSPSITNQVLVGVNYFDQVFLDFNTDFDPISLGFNTGASILGAPEIKLGQQATSQLGEVGLTPPLGRNDITGHITDALSWTVGAHQFRFGGEFRQVQLDEFYHTNQRGTFTFSGQRGPWTTAPTESDLTADTNTLILADFLGGYLDRGTIARGNPERQVFVNTFSLFGQDAWQLSRKFNLNYGLRYDYEGPLHNGNKDLSVFIPNKGGIVFQGNGIDSVYPAQYTSLSPRLGFAWQPQENGNTVIRGGVGLFFDTPNLNIFLSQNPGNGGAVGLQGNPAGPSPVLTLGIPTQVIVPNQLLAPTGVDPTTACVVTPDNVSPCGLFSVNQNLRNPHNVNYSINIQKSFGSKVVAQLGYVGSSGRKLILLRDINQPAFNSAGANVDAYTQQISRPYYSTFPNYGAINEAASAGNSNYNALQAVLRLRSWHGLSSQASYTWSHSLDEGTQWRNVLPQDSTNIQGDYGNSDYDVRNTFNAYFIYDVPGSSSGPHWLSYGWQVNSLISLHGGEPFSVLSSSDNSGTGEGYQRAVQVLPDPYAGVSHKFADQQVTWVNPAAFADGPTGTFVGTSRRNQLFGQGFEDVDLSVFKTGSIGEWVKIQFRAELFNVFNRKNLSPPSNTVGDGFGVISDTIGDYNGAPGIGPGEPFNTQFGLKVIF
jgi:hypothetical protein